MVHAVNKAKVYRKKIRYRRVCQLTLELEYYKALIITTHVISTQSIEEIMTSSSLGPGVGWALQL